MACERSGRVRDAFRALGHNAISADLEPTDVDGPHHQGDVTELLRKRWDMVIAFPPCTDLANVNAQHMPAKRADGRAARAAWFWQECWQANADKVCVENPTPAKGLLPRPHQIIQPWEFGHPYTKRTCLWLRGLPPLLPTDILVGKYTSWTHPNGSNKPAKHRSETFPGIAQAMAEQWGQA